MKDRGGYATLLAVMTAIFAAGVALTSLGWFFPPCGFRAMTGISCPGCGLTRSVIATVHLDFGEAFAYHAFGPVILAIAVALWIYGVVGMVRVPPPESVWETRWIIPALVTLLVTYLGYWGLRVALGIDV